MNRVISYIKWSPLSIGGGSVRKFLQLFNDFFYLFIAEDGEMKMYKREEEVDGMVVDPLKALHQVKGALLLSLLI